MEKHETGQSEVARTDQNEDQPIGATRKNRLLRIIGGGVLVMMALALSVLFLIGSLNLWYWHAWSAWVEVLMIVIVIGFMITVVTIYVMDLVRLGKMNSLSDSGYNDR